MKRQILSITAGLVVLIAGAVFAQSSLNTPAPGPSQETKPGQTNNNLQNPGSPQMQTDKVVRENGTAEGTAAESNARTQATESTTSAPMDQPSGDQTTTAPPADTTNTTAPPADTTSTTAPPADTTTAAPPASTSGSTMTPPTTTTTTTTGSYNGSASSSTTDTSTGTTDASSTTPSSLPKTASDLPTLALMGLLALSGFFAVRVYAKRNA